MVGFERRGAQGGVIFKKSVGAAVKRNVSGKTQPGKDGMDWRKKVLKGVLE